jgi:hypothetical protein
MRKEGGKEKKEGKLSQRRRQKGRDRKRRSVRSGKVREEERNKECSGNARGGAESRKGG